MAIIMENILKGVDVSSRIAQMRKEAQEKVNKNNNRVTQPFQTLALDLADKLGDRKNVSIYMGICKKRSRQHIDEALYFVLNSNAKNKAKLFMWKMKQLKQGS